MSEKNAALKAEKPEIIIGLVGALGTDLKSVAVQTEQFLSEVGYSCTHLRLSELLREFINEHAFETTLTEETVEARLDSYMNAGNEMRRKMKRGDALALLTILRIRRERYAFYKGSSPQDSDRPIPSHAYILDSLKHPDEVKRLREVYGSSFFLISVYAPRSLRLDELTQRIMHSRNLFRKEGLEADAMKLLERDEEEKENELGQQVRKTFWRGDAYVDARSSRQREHSLRRSLEIWFGHPFHTPTRDEYLMFVARAAAYRSASMGRQVGAVIAAEDGSVIATGTNEVPKAGGGQYWCGDNDDARDHVGGHDSSDIMRRELLGDILERLKALNLLQMPIDKNATMLVDELLYGNNAVMQAAEFNSLTEFQRPVHAEMSALTDAARRGIAVSGGILYTTTFPCHGCARHIVAAGVSRVVYIEPYAKSLVRTLHSDSITIDDAETVSNKVRFEPFIGVAPRRYMELFAMGKRKEERGQAVKWLPSEAAPRIGGWYHGASVANEVASLRDLQRFTEGMETEQTQGTDAKQPSSQA